jgi:hypothetical protein
MPTEWHLHYDDWIIGDGEPDRDVGDVFDWFALAFWAKERLTAADHETKSAIPMSDFRYRVVAEVTHISRIACIIDFGLKATTTDDVLPLGCQKGDFVTGEIGLRLPLVTEVGPEAEFKALAHRWKVNKISADVTQYIQCQDNPRFFARDESRIRYEDVPATYSVKAHTYILHCCEVPNM